MEREQPNPGSEKRHSRLLAAGAAAVVVLGGLGAFALLPHDSSKPAARPDASFVKVAENSPRPPSMVNTAAPFSFADLVERVSPAVVTITVEQKQDASPASMQIPNDIPDPFKQFFRQFGFNGHGFTIPHKAIAMGSGFIIDKSGYIVTNNHVIAHGAKITVKLANGHKYIAKLIGTDPSTDIALLKIKGDKPFPSVQFADDRQLRVGDWVVAVGNPFGLSNTVTAGIVSSIGRNLDEPGNGQYTDFIQIDAPINRGNSGGPTFDLNGHVIGMNTMIYSPSGGSVGIGFAIPSTTIRDVVTQLKEHGKVTRGWLGVEIQSLTPDMAASLGLKDPRGAIVAKVIGGSPAAKAGFRQGDVIIAVNGKAIEDARDLTRHVAALPVKGKAAFTVVRNGNSKTLTAVIAKRTEQDVASNEPASGNIEPGSTEKALGMDLEALNADARHEFNLGDSVTGVVITKVDPNSNAAEKGLEPGDVVQSVGNEAVRTPADVRKRIAAARAAGRKSVLLLVTSSNGQRFVAVDLG